MEQQQTEREWFAAWLPKPTAVHAEPEGASFVDEVRTELKAVTGHLLDPSAAGIWAAIPHLECAIALFAQHTPLAPGQPATLRPALDALREELALANRLFENAYELQSGWATQVGLNMDGSPRQLLYGRHGESVASEALPPDTWEG